MASTAPTSEYRPGERSKNQRWLSRSVRHLNRFDPMRRDEPVIVVATGVGIDREVFAASQIRRGVPVVVVPASGIGAWDTALDWKRGIDFGGMKNRLGAFWPPTEVYICREVLPDRTAARPRQQRG